MVVERVNGDRLKSSPTKTENEWIVGLECACVPSMSFDTDLNKTEPFLCRKKTTNNEWPMRIEVLDHLARDVFELDANI